MSTAQKAAATGSTVTIEYGDESYEIDPEGITLDALEAFESDKYIAGLKLILGDEQYARYKKAHPRVVDLEQFIQAMFAAVGKGNSGASSLS